jgi:hypothetical protein
MNFKSKIFSIVKFIVSNEISKEEDCYLIAYDLTSMRS